MSQTCAKCGLAANSSAELDQHFEYAKHWEDPDYPLFRARQRVVQAREDVEFAKVALSEALTELEMMQDRTVPS